MPKASEKVKKQINVACAVCRKSEADGVQLFTCSQCRSISYCSKECQVYHWKRGGHKALCKSFNAGDANQIVDPEHKAPEYEDIKQQTLRALPRDMKQIFALFEKKGTDEAALKKMKKLFLRQTKANKHIFFFLCLDVLAVAPTKMLDLPTSPLKLALQYVDPNVLCTMNNDKGGGTALHAVCLWKDPSAGRVSDNQLVIARQLLEAGAKVGATTSKDRAKCTALHFACWSKSSTNLELIQLLLDKGADPNAPNMFGETPLMYTLAFAPGAAKFLLEYAADKLDLNRVAYSNSDNVAGKSILAQVRGVILQLSISYSGFESKEKTPSNVEEHAKTGYLIGQLKELEELLVARGALEIRPPQNEYKYKTKLALARQKGYI